MGMNETTKQKWQVGMLVRKMVTRYLDKLYIFWFW